MRFIKDKLFSHVEHVSFSTSCLGSDVASFKPSFLIFILQRVFPVQGINKWNKFLAIVVCIFLFCITTDTAFSGMHAHSKTPQGLRCTGYMPYFICLYTTYISVRCLDGNIIMIVKTSTARKPPRHAKEGLNLC